MGIFKRLSDIMTANVNDMLDRAEDPEKMMKQIIREMDEAIQGAKRNVAQAIAGEKKLGKELETNKRLRDEWHKKAQEAVALDREDLARKALTRKKEHESVIAGLEPQHVEAEKTAENLRKTLGALQAKLADAKRRQTVLIARKKTAEAQMAAQNGLSRARGKSKAESFAKFERFEEQVNDMEAEASALEDVNQADTVVDEEFEKLGKEDDIELELQKMKQQAKEGGKAEGE